MKASTNTKSGPRRSFSVRAGQRTRNNNSQLLMPTNTQGLTGLIQALQSVDPSAPLARLNRTTISDNNGGRIQL